MLVSLPSFLLLLQCLSKRLAFERRARCVWTKSLSRNLCNRPVATRNAVNVLLNIFQPPSKILKRLLGHWESKGSASPISSVVNVMRRFPFRSFSKFRPVCPQSSLECSAASSSVTLSLVNVLSRVAFARLFSLLPLKNARRSAAAAAVLPLSETSSVKVFLKRGTIFQI